MPDGPEPIESTACDRYAGFSERLQVTVEMTILGGHVEKISLSAPAIAQAAQPNAVKPHPYLASMLSGIEQGHTEFPNIPRRLRARPFQARVLELVSATPRGRTTTYGAIARALGDPRSARAVGSACAKNPLLLLVPCHRVVAANGDLVHYAGFGGIATNRRLLDLENADPRIQRAQAPGFSPGIASGAVGSGHIRSAFTGVSWNSH